MNRRIRDVFKGVEVKVVNSGMYENSTNTYKSISIGGKEVKQRFTSYPSDKTISGRTDFWRKSLVLATDGYEVNGKIKVFGKSFDVSIEKVGKNGNKYREILVNGRKVGAFFHSKQVAIFNNICL